MNDERKAVCPACGEVSTETIITGGLTGYVANRTVGSLMDSNAGKMTTASRQEKEQAFKDSAQKAKNVLREQKGKETRTLGPKERPWWRPNSDRPDPSLSKLSVSESNKYIATGKKD